MKHLFKKSILIRSIGLATLLPALSHAAGYKLEFMSPSTLADAGDAAVVQDAGTNWYNSAGDVDLPPQYVLSGIQVWSKSKFTGQTTATTGVPVTGPNDQSSTSSPHSFLPAVHFVMPLTPHVSFGISAVPAWGLMNQYGNNDSITRYSLNRVYTKTIDVAPSVAVRINKQWSIGFGPDFNYFQVMNNTNAYTAALGTTGDSISRYSASDWSNGWHAGVLYKLDERTRFGLNYRSRIVSHLQGHSDFAAPGGPSAGLYETNMFRVNIPLPPVTTFSIYHDMNAKWAMMGTISYEQWGVIKAYYGQNYARPIAPNFINITSMQAMHNTIDLGIGTHYTLNDRWMLRGSFKYLATPTNGAYRQLYFPDAPKYGINLGARYTLNKKFAFDMIYAHVFTPSVGINDVNPSSLSTASGKIRTRIDLVGAQLVWTLM